MQFNYRNNKNAGAVAAYYNKPLKAANFFEIKALSDEEAEILIYDVIGWPFNDAGDFVRALAELKQKNVTVRINSPGGDVFDGFAIYNALKTHSAKVTTRIESLAASAASFISLAGKERQAYKNAIVMIHEPWLYTVGNQYQLRDDADILEKLSDNMIDAYADNTGLGKRAWKDMMAKGETWWNAEEAKKNGFIHTVLDGRGAKASFDLSIFANAPKDDPPIRMIENALRDAGFSHTEAKREAGALLARRKQNDGAETGEADILAALDKTINTMRK